VKSGVAASRVAGATPPPSRVFYNNTPPAPVSRADEGILGAIGEDPILSTIRDELFTTQPAGLDRVGRGGSQTSQSSAHDLNLKLRDDLGGVDLMREHRDIFEAYSGSYIEVPSPRDTARYEAAREAYRARAEEMLAKVETLGEWNPVEIGGSLRNPFWTPVGGRADSFGQQGLISDDIATYMNNRARILQDVHNRTVNDQIISELIDRGVALEAARYGTEHWTVLSEVFAASNPRVTIAVHNQTFLNKVLEEGVMLNQYYTNQSSGALAPFNRVGTELQVMGIPIERGPMARPVYGYLSVENPAAFANDLSPMLRDVIGEGAITSVGRPRGYGDVNLVFSPETAANSTFTVGDSLGSQVIASRINGATPSDVGFAAGPFLQGRAGTQASQMGERALYGTQPYLEAQVYQPDLRSVVEIHVSTGGPQGRNIAIEARAKIKALTGNDVEIFLAEERRYGTTFGYDSRRFTGQ
jgi:hypothetical protein